MTRRYLGAVVACAGAAALAASGAVASGVTAAGVAASGATVLAAQQPSVAAVFTQRQADDGKAAYAARCASCHMPDLSGNNDVPALADANFLGTWGSRSTKELYDYTVGTMPPGGPPLSPEAGAAIVAHILRVNGAPSGEHALDASTAALIAHVTATGAGTP